MANAKINRHTVFAGRPVTLLDLITNDGEYVTQSDISSISATITDLDTSVAVNVPVVVADSILNAPAVVLGWSRGTPGCNSTIYLNGSHWPSANRVYQVTVVYTPTSGAAFQSVYRLATI